MHLAWSDEDILMTLVIVSAIGVPVLYFFVKSRLSARSSRARSGRRSLLLATLRLPGADLSRLAEGGAAAACDWRAEPEDVVTELNAVLPASHHLTAIPADEGVTLSRASRALSLSSKALDASAEEGGVLTVVAAANQLLAGDYEFRQVLDDPSDTYVFVARPASLWLECEQAYRREVERAFARIRARAD